jgi:exodeoxyribonuclease-3
VVYSGQKTYNGVAFISRFPIEEVMTDIPVFDDPQRRILAVTSGNIRFINLYVPNGAAVGSDKYAYKLQWLEHIRHFIAGQLEIYPKLVVLGDMNIAPEDCDVHDPIAWEGSVLVSPLERKAFQDLLVLGLHDSFRLFPQDEKIFSWWDYRMASFRRNLGLRIDHIMLSQALSECCRAAGIDKGPRKLERPSDHAPVWVELAISEDF